MHKTKNRTHLNREDELLQVRLILMENCQHPNLTARQYVANHIDRAAESFESDILLLRRTKPLRLKTSI